MIYSLPTLTTKRSCGGCSACCVAYPLLPNPGWWPEGKPAATPCRFLGCRGCSIHDQPRPNVCTDFQCDYLDGSLGSNAEAWRPDRCGVIVNGGQSLKLIFQGRDNVPVDLDPDLLGVTLWEVWPRAILGLDPHKLRYRLGKQKYRWAYTAVGPYGLDLFGHDPRLKDLPRAMHRANDFGVWWITDEEKDYSREVVGWWER